MPSIRMGTRPLRRGTLGTPPPAPEGSAPRSPTRGVRGQPARARGPRGSGRRPGGRGGTARSASGRGRATHPPEVAPEIPPTGRVRHVRIRVRRETPVVRDASLGEGPSQQGNWPPSSSEASALTSEGTSDSPSSSQAPQSEACTTTSSSDSRASADNSTEEPESDSSGEEGEGEEDERWTGTSGSDADGEEDGESGSPREFTSSLPPPAWVMTFVRPHMRRPLDRF